MQDFISFIQLHWQLSLLFAVLLVLLGIIEYIRNKRGAQHISPMQLTHLINHQNAVVVDLRTAETFAKGHIIGAMSIPVSEFKEKSKKLEKLKLQPLVMVCEKGLDSVKIATELKDQGFQAQVLDGGITAWVSADMPLVRE